MAKQLDWHVAVYASNEEERIGACLRSIAVALEGRSFLVTVLVNGSRDNSAETALRAARDGMPVEVYAISYGDKANAINQFIHALRRPAHLVGEVDAYAIVGVRSFTGMAAALERSQEARAATGVAITGRTMPSVTAETLVVGGRLHGQLHAFRPDFLDRMVARGIRLPIGYYWGDGLLGSMSAHDLDPLTEPWRNERVVGVAEATYAIPVLSPFRLGDIRRQYRREIRQARGKLENAAIQQVIYRTGYEGLPAWSNDLVADLVATGPVPPATGRARYFRRVALKEVASFRPPSPDALLPRRLG